MSRLSHERRHCFPLEFAKLLVSRETDQIRLVNAMRQRGYRISKQFMSQLSTGSRPCPAQQLRRICEVLQCDEIERLRMHKAAAIDYGFELGGMG